MATDEDLTVPTPPVVGADDEITHALSFVPQEVGVTKPDAILTADHVTRSFGGIRAVDVDHVEFQRGAITALIGPNGAGKTTFFNLLTGFDRADTGRWDLNGSIPLANRSAAHVARQGVVRTFQLTKALARLTVLDNMLLAARGQRGEGMLGALVRPLWARQERENAERAREILARFKLDAKASDFAGSLSGGQRKLLEMARALMTDPEIIMLDEPMAGVNPALVQTLLGHIQALRDAGMTVIFVEHDMHAVRHISEWVVVMAEGRIVAEGLARTIMDNQAVVDAYLGARHDVDLGDDSLIDPEQLAKLTAVRQRDLAEQKG